VQRCNLCGGTTWKTRERHGATRVVECRCGLVFVTPVPSRGVIEAAYQDDYYEAWQAQGSARRRMWERRADLVDEVAGTAGRLLDVGCGDGTFLRTAQKHGWRVVGTELSRNAVERSKDVQLSQGEVWEAAFPASSFDVVTSWHVIEHAGDPMRMAREMNRLLTPGGWLILATPNVNDYIFRVGYAAGRLRWPTLYEADERELHLYHFSESTLVRLLAEAGFTEIRTGFDEGAATVPSKRAVNRLAHAWYRLTGVNWGIGLLVVARKPTAMPSDQEDNYVSTQRAASEE